MTALYSMWAISQTILCEIHKTINIVHKCPPMKTTDKQNLFFSWMLCSCKITKQTNEKFITKYFSLFCVCVCVRALSHLVMSNSLWPHELQLTSTSVHEIPQVGSHSLLQGIFPTQGSNPGLRIAGLFLNVWVTRKPALLYLVSIMCFSYKCIHLRKFHSHAITLSSH